MENWHNGEYVAPEIDVIVIKSQEVLCISFGIGGDEGEGNGYGFEPW